MKLLTLEEVSEVTRLPVSTLRYLRHRGEGPPSFKLGRRVVVQETDLLAWIAAQAKADTDRRQVVA